MSKYSQSVIANNPVSYWRLNETTGTTAVDSMGVNNGTYVASPILGGAGFVTGDTGAMNLVNTSQYCSTPITTSYNTFSVECIFVVSSWPITGGGCLVTHREYFAGTTTSFPFSITVLTTKHIDVSFSIGDDSNVDLVLYTPLIKLNQAYHIAVTRDGGTGVTRLYLNGVLVSDGILTAPLSTYSGNWLIGRMTENGGGVGITTLQGHISHVALYNYELPASSILAHYNNISYTVPTTSTTQVSTGDPYWYDGVRLLVPLSGTAESGANSIFDDKSRVPKTFSATGNKIRSVRTPTDPFGGSYGSVEFSAGNYLAYPSDTIINTIGLQDFRIEGWIYIKSFALAPTLVYVGRRNTSATFGGFGVLLDPAGIVFETAFTNTTFVDYRGTFSLSTNQWYYAAVFRNSTGIYAQINNTIVTMDAGNLQPANTTPVTTPQQVTNPNNRTITIGGSGGDDSSNINLYPSDAYISNVRITVGNARTGTTMPTAPFPNYIRTYTGSINNSTNIQYWNTTAVTSTTGAFVSSATTDNNTILVKDANQTAAPVNIYISPKATNWAAQTLYNINDTIIPTNTNIPHIWKCISTANVYSGYEVMALLGTSTIGATATLVDSSKEGRVFTNNNGVVIGSTNPHYGNSSLIFNGTANQGITFPVTESLNFYNADFTIEFWYYPISTQAYGRVMQLANADVFGGWSLSHDNLAASSVTLNTSSTGSAWEGSGITIPLTLNTWNHIAFTRSNMVIKGWVNGVQQGTPYTTGITYAGAGTGCIGGQTTGISRTITGQIQDLRIIKGFARYTAPFTPPGSIIPVGRTSIIEPNWQIGKDIVDGDITWQYVAPLITPQPLTYKTTV
jgi:hypothetical protein